MSRHDDEIEARDRRIAKLVAECGVLEEQLARARRDRGALTSLVRGALADGALVGEYATHARRVLAG